MPSARSRPDAAPRSFSVVFSYSTIHVPLAAEALLASFRRLARCRRAICRFSRDDSASGRRYSFRGRDPHPRSNGCASNRVETPLADVAEISSRERLYHADANRAASMPPRPPLPAIRLVLLRLFFSLSQAIALLTHVLPPVSPAPRETTCSVPAPSSPHARIDTAVARVHGRPRLCQSLSRRRGLHAAMDGGYALLPASVRSNKRVGRSRGRATCGRLVAVSGAVA